MNRYEKSTQNRNTAARLNEEWDIGAAQARYRETGNWYHRLERFPAALIDGRGYVLFQTESELRSSPHVHIGKQIGIPNGISSIPDYVRVVESDVLPRLDVDIHTLSATEGHRQLVLHLQRERNQTVVRNNKKQATSLDCEVCGFSFGRAYGGFASKYCEVHHLLPLSEVDRSTTTRMDDLAILCANCHRVVHLRNPPFTLDEVRSTLAK